MITKSSRWLILLTVCSCRVIQAQTELNRLYPPLVTLGTSTVVEAEGNFPAWPVDFLCDRKDICVQAGKEKGQLRVSFAKGAQQGPVWIRAADNRTVSSAVPLLVERLPSDVEVEQNDAPEASQALTLPVCVGGRLSKRGDVDVFRVRIAAGDRLIATVIAHEILRSPMDAVLQVCDIHGNVLAQVDDERGLDPQLVYESTEDADVLVRLFAFPETPNSTIDFAGAESFLYALRLTTEAVMDHCLPLFSASDSLAEGNSGDVRCFGWNASSSLETILQPATKVSPVTVQQANTPGWQWLPPPPHLLAAHSPNEFLTVFERSPAAANIMELPCLCAGHIALPGERDRFRLKVKSGGLIRAEVYSRRFGFHLDPVLELRDADSGKRIAVNDDRGRREYDAALEYEPQEAQELELVISDLVDGCGPRHAYTIVVTEVVPGVSLSSESDSFALQAGEEVEIPVKIERRGGFSKRLDIHPVGLPQDVTWSSVVSEPKGESSQSVALTLSADSAAKPRRLVFEIVASESVGKPDEDKLLPADDRPASTSKRQRSYVCRYELRPHVRPSRLWLTIQ